MRQPLRAERGGWLASLNAREVGETAVDLGAGRAKKTDVIDYGVGMVLHAKVGDRVEAGQELVTVHANSPERLQTALQRLAGAFTLSDAPCDPLPLFYDVIS